MPFILHEEQKKLLGEWKDFGNCSADNCGTKCGQCGKQMQNRNCTSGNFENCTNDDRQRYITCNISCPSTSKSGNGIYNVTSIVLPS